MSVETGFLSTITEQEKIVMFEIKAFLEEEFGIKDSVAWNDWNVLRFCRARKFDSKLVKEMIRKFMHWFKEGGFDKVGEANLDEFINLRSLTMNGYYGTDKMGRPIYIDKVSGLKESEVFKQYSDARLTLYYVQSYERLVHIILPECSRLAGRRVEQTFTIMDLDGVNIFKLFTGKIKAFVQLASEIGQNYYPEILGGMFIINSGILFSGIWVLVKPWLDKKTQNKITIISGSGKKELAKVVDLDKLPVCVGGTCALDLRTDPGPWSAELTNSYKNKTVYHSDKGIYQQYFPNIDK